MANNNGSKQTSELFPSPVQSFPSWAGAGFLHNRTRVLVPLPPVFLQVDQVSQAVVQVRLSLCRDINRKMYDRVIDTFFIDRFVCAPFTSYSSSSSSSSLSLVDGNWSAGKLGLPVAKRVAMGRGHAYDRVTIPLRPTKEKIVKEKEIIQKFVWSAIFQVNLTCVFLGGGDGWHFRLSMMLHFHSHLTISSPKGH